MSFQAVRAALANPIEALKYEQASGAAGLNARRSLKAEGTPKTAVLGRAEGVIRAGRTDERDGTSPQN